MNRQTALSLYFLFLFLYVVLLYYGCRLSIVSSIALGGLVSFFLLNVFYPPRYLTTDTFDETFYIYFVVYVVTIIFLAIYLIVICVKDVRPAIP